MSSNAPELPSSGWRILYLPAYQAFIGDSANLRYAGVVADWIVAVREHGPPPDGIEAGDDYHLSAIPGTSLTVEYLVIPSEYLVIVKQFLPA